MNSAYPFRRAERSLFKELFESPAKVHLNGGVITGGAIPNFGFPLNGISQYVTYAIGATLLSRPQLSFECIFTPDVDWDVDANFYLFSSTAAELYGVLHLNDASANSLVVIVGSTWLAIPFADYSPHWNVGEENRIIASLNSGANWVWLNGVSILVDHTTAWVPGNPTGLRVGAYIAAGSYFDGTIHSIEFRAGLLTQLDVDAIESDSLYTYMNRANLVLDMEEQTERAGTILGTTETLTDGDCEAVGVGAWTAFGGAALSKVAGSPGGSGSQVIHITGAVAGAAYQLTTSVVGKRYRVRGWARGDGTGVPGINTVGLGAVIWTGDGSGAWQYFDAVAVSDHNAGFLFRHQSGGGAGNWVEFDDVECFETDELLSDPDMEETGVGAWTAVNNADMTKVTSTPYEGTQCFRVAYDGTNYPSANQTIVTVGRKYRLTGRGRGDGTWGWSIKDGGVTLFTGTSSTDWQGFDIIYTATVTSLRFLSLATGAGYLDLDAISVKPVLVQTLDKSPNGHVCLLGDGFTPATIPTFENPGFDFDGANQYMQVLDGSFLYEDAITLVVVFHPDYGEVTPSHKFLFDDTTGLKYSMLKANTGGIQVYMGGTAGGATAVATAPHWRVNGLNVLIITVDAARMSTMLNGALIGDNAIAYTKVAVTSLNLWRRANDTQHHSGEGNGFLSFPFVLSPLQARDLTISLGVNV